MTPPTRRDYLLVALFCVLLYGTLMVVGGPLTMHEGALSQTSRHMAADRDWVIPHYGQAPWIERPPLPQWLAVGVAALVNHSESEWAYRIGPALSATTTVLLTTWLCGAFFGRVRGILSGLILATMYEFARYATLAEADMVLCPIVAATLCLFAYLEVLRPRAADESIHPLGRRPWAVAAFFALLGLTELAKGLIFGTVMALVPIAGYLLWHFDLRRVGRYVWLPGWLLFAAIGLAWPLAVLARLPDAQQVWGTDLLGRLNDHYLEEPPWYYAVHGLWVIAPWTITALVGLWGTARAVREQPGSPQRFVWCWALLPPLVFSLAQGKHHHYMIHFLAPWAILAAEGCVWIWQQVQRSPKRLHCPQTAAQLAALALVLAGLGLWLTGSPLLALLLGGPACACLLWWLAFHADGRVAIAGGFALLLVLYGAGFACKSAYLHRSGEDTAFLREARRLVPASEQVLVLGDQEALEGLRVLFYCDAQAFLLHNLTFLRHAEVRGPVVHVLARAREEMWLEPYGDVQLLLHSQHSRREESAEDRWALFRVRLRPDLHREIGPVAISPMQAMYRAPGPFLE